MVPCTANPLGHGRRAFRMLAVIWCLFPLVAFLSNETGVYGVLVMTRGDDYDPACDEYLNVNEGETLRMDCYASSDNLDYVRWGKVISALNTDWLTVNSRVPTSDSRVNVDSSSYQYEGQNYSAYAISITDMTASDYGMYICDVRWQGDYYGFYTSRGYVFVTVNIFPHDDPVCLVGDASSTDDVVNAQCETAAGIPRVDITWTIQETGDEVPSLIYNYSLGGQARLWSPLRLEQELRYHVLVCTVTSSAFPGRNRSCTIGPVEQLAAATTSPFTPATFISESSTQPTSTPTRAVSGTTQTGYIAAAAAVIPATFAVGFLVSVACTKRRYRRNERPTSNPIRELPSIPEAGQPPADMEPYAVTYKMPENDVTLARLGSVSAYETQVGRGEDVDDAGYEVPRRIDENIVTSSNLELQ